MSAATTLALAQTAAIALLLADALDSVAGWHVSQWRRLSRSACWRARRFSVDVESWLTPTMSICLRCCLMGSMGV